MYVFMYDICLYLAVNCLSEAITSLKWNLNLITFIF